MADNIIGYTDPKFAKVKEVFRKNFAEGWEFEGAGFAVYYKGKPVVDLAGGWADFSSLRKWNDKTKTIVFSCTKSVGAVCIAILVDRGYIKYEDKVTNFWPEFGQNGKEDISVEMVMNHQAGLPVFEDDIPLEDAMDHEKIAKNIEKSTPLWKPGTKSGYHAVTYGWLVDQIIRHADPQRRGIGQFFREEVGQKHNLDLHIGLPTEEEYTVARLAPGNLRYLLREIWATPQILHLLFTMTLARIMKWGVPRVFTYPSFLQLQGTHITPNNPELHFIEQAGALGITRAKDLAKFFSLFIRGDIVSKDLVERFYEPVVNSMDAVACFQSIKGHGFWYEQHPKKRSKYLFGHPGYGGNNLMIDHEEDLVVAYVTNGLKTGIGEMSRCYRVLRDTVFECLDKFPKENVSGVSIQEATADAELLHN